MTSNELVRVERLEVRRGGFRLEVPAFSVAPGEVVGVVGPNGAGKTTLLETLVGLRPASDGVVRALGVDPWRHPGVREEIGFAADDMAVFSGRVDRVLRQLSGYYRGWDPTLVERLLERFRLDPAQRTERLSRGQGTRFRLLTAMAFRPRLLVLDEPAAGLDVGGRRALLESVLEVVHDPTRAVVVSSHMLADVERVADRLLVLDGGRVVTAGGTDELVGDDRTLEEALVAWGAAG